MQCACGGACPRCRETRAPATKLPANAPGERYERDVPVRAKLAVSAPGDALEQEADGVAKRALRMPDPGRSDPAATRSELRLSRYASSARQYESAEVPSAVHDVVRSAGEALDPALRALMEPRFGQDFGGVRVHRDGRAADSAATINASAYAAGPHIVFAAGQYRPETANGLQLVAHELAHVVQQGAAPETGRAGARGPLAIAGGGAAPGLQRDEAKNDDAKAYVDILRTTHAIEGKKDSKRKALAVIERGFKGTEDFWLPDDDNYLLVAELLHGRVTNDDRDGILEVLERMANFLLGKIFAPGKIPIETLVKAFPGKSADRLNDFFARRFQGGLNAVQGGSGKAKGERMPPGLKLSSLELVRKLLEWLKGNKKTASKFFNEAWSKNKIMLLGEMHFDDIQREFSADMLQANGGADTGLALEIHIQEQSEVDYYIKHGKVSADAKGWWKGEDRYKKILDAARATKTQVIAMDSAATDDRDKHMAAEVEKLAKTKAKIMVFVGAMHIKEAGSALGGLLAAKFGGTSYAVDMFYPQKSDYIYWLINDAFPQEKSMGFDVDASPLASHQDPDMLKDSLGGDLDGYIYFASDDAYK